MKIAIISDIHANYEALRSFSESYDELWVAGDLVNFGPRPGEVIEWVRSRAHCVVRGNHDHAVGYEADPRCSPAYQAMGAETSAYSSSILTEDQKQYLRLLPLAAERTLGGVRFHICHATPSNPLFGFLAQEAEGWKDEVESTSAGLVVVGHTHVPFSREFARQRLVNPGSLGGLGAASPQASYALWEDGHLQLKRYSYPLRNTVEEIQKMPVSPSVQGQLIEFFSTGDVAAGKA
jgi:protein phosphatase